MLPLRFEVSQCVDTLLLLYYAWLGVWVNRAEAETEVNHVGLPFSVFGAELKIHKGKREMGVGKGGEEGPQPQYNPSLPAECLLLRSPPVP